MRFKDDVIGARFDDLHPQLINIIEELDKFLQRQYGIHFTVTATTSTRKEDAELKRVSDTHRTRRAVDIRTKDLPDHIVAEMISFLNIGYGDLGAVSANGPKIVVYNDHGTARHLHIQLNREFSLEELNYG